MSSRASVADGRALRGVCDGLAAVGARSVAATVSLVGLALGVTGCGGTPDVPEAAQPMLSPPRSLEYLAIVVRGDPTSWSSLEADCAVVVRNPQIPGEQNVQVLPAGRLQFLRPAAVRLTAPANGSALHMVGDGRSYQVDMPIFRDAYGGLYDEPLVPAPRRIHFTPAAVADALDPWRLMANKGLVVFQWEGASALEALELVTEPQASLRLTGAVIIDRRADRIMAIETYDEDGSVRSRVRYDRVETLRGYDDKAVLLPTDFTVTYLQERTTVRVVLTNVKMNPELPADSFRVKP